MLYEGYLLWPYRRSALKNQHRWTIGGVYPASYGTDLMQTQCLVVADPDATVDVEVRFLHVVTRDVARCPLSSVTFHRFAASSQCAAATVLQNCMSRRRSNLSAT